MGAEGGKKMTWKRVGDGDRWRCHGSLRSGVGFD